MPLNSDQRSEYKGLLVRGQLRAAIEYLRQHGEGERAALLTRQMTDLGQMPQGPPTARLQNAYHLYYRDIFWQQLAREEAAAALLQRLQSILDQPGLADLDGAEEAVRQVFESAGYSFLGGDTGSWRGPYIWQSTQMQTFQVQLHDGIQPVTVQWMDGFIERSWLYFISAGETGAGGWVTGGSGDLYCVRSAYPDLNSPAFTVSYLKHEARHLRDRQYGDILPKDLEYRAKLTEIYYGAFADGLAALIHQADGADPAQSHPYASWRILADLSQHVLGRPYETDPAAFAAHMSAVRACALALLERHTRTLLAARATHAQGAISIV